MDTFQNKIMTMMMMMTTMTSLSSMMMMNMMMADRPGAAPDRREAWQ
jgi:hypothetical protein